MPYYAIIFDEISPPFWFLSPKSQPLEISSNAIDLEGPVLRSSLHGIGDVREMQEHRPGEMIAGEVLKVSVTRFQTRSAEIRFRFDLDSIGLDWMQI
jgi:hypothetical protein